MSSIISLGFLGLLMVLVQVISGQQGCRLPNNGPIGQCIPIKSCDSIVALINRGQQLTQGESNFIVKSFCGRLNGVQMICCPISKLQVNKTTSIDDLATHPNAGLLDLHQCGESSADKISNGMITKPLEFPWMALIRKVTNDNELMVNCGGTLISKRYVLTAAHCMEDVPGPIQLHSVVLGEHDTATEMDCTRFYCADPIQEIRVERQIPHPEFSLTTAKNDIGLLRLSENAKLSDSVRPVCLPFTMESQNHKLPKVIVTGWGFTEEHIVSTVLLKAILQVTPQDTCKSIYWDHYQNRVSVDSTTLCAYGGKTHSCNGDSGGPAVFIGTTGRLGPRYFQYGIVSAGSMSCGADLNIPGLYTRVSSYMKWILDNISD